jgi:hypothetical protein
LTNRIDTNWPANQKALHIPESPSLIDHSGDLYAGMYKANTYHPSAHQDKKLSTQELSRTIFEMTHQDQGSLEQYKKAMSMFVRQLLAHVDSVRL